MSDEIRALRELVQRQEKELNNLRHFEKLYSNKRCANGYPQIRGLVCSLCGHDDTDSPGSCGRVK